jgi:hypothetical protein
MEECVLRRTFRVIFDSMMGNPSAKSIGLGSTKDIIKQMIDEIPTFMVREER